MSMHSKQLPARTTAAPGSVLLDASFALRPRWTQNNYKLFFDWLGIQLGHKHLDGFYKVTLRDIQKHGGSQILRYFKNSAAALKTAYPEHAWNPWKFGKFRSFWAKQHNQKKFFDWLGLQ